MGKRNQFNLIGYLIDLFKIINQQLEPSNLIGSPAVEPLDMPDIAYHEQLIELSHLRIVDTGNGKAPHPWRLLNKKHIERIVHLKF